MSDSDSQEDQIAFRQESVDNVFGQDGKPFFVQSPPNLSMYTLSFVCLIAFVFISLYFIKLPVHITAIGEVIAGKDYHQVVVNEDDKIVTKISVDEGQEVTKGQLLLQLSNRDEQATQAKLLDINVQIDALNEHIQEIENYFSLSSKNIQQSRKVQTQIVAQLEQKLATENEVLRRYEANVANGLTSAIFVDEQRRVVAQSESNLIKEQAVFTALDLRQLEINDNYKREKDSDLNQIARLKLERERLSNGMQILSPCDCIVDNLFLELGLPVVAGQSILTLSRTRESSSLLLYVPASQYRSIESGRQIQVNLASYPSNKYGVLTASIESVSASPVPGNMVRQQGQGLQNATYFVLKAVIDKVPNDVTLVTGMSVDSDIVIDQVSLFEMMFDLSIKR